MSTLKVRPSTCRVPEQNAPAEFVCVPPMVLDGLVCAVVVTASRKSEIATATPAILGRIPLLRLLRVSLTRTVCSDAIPLPLYIWVFCSRACSRATPGRRVLPGAPGLPGETPSGSRAQGIEKLYRTQSSSIPRRLHSAWFPDRRSILPILGG